MIVQGIQVFRFKVNSDSIFTKPLNLSEDVREGGAEPAYRPAQNEIIITGSLLQLLKGAASFQRHTVHTLIGVGSGK